ncbi:MAG: basic amino acid ABC transporter substrate-binding protein, partial [Spirochaetota bacterium]
FALAAVAFTGCAQKTGEKLIIASDCTWPPMEFIDGNKQMVGFDIDLINAAAKAGGFEVEVRNAAWDGIFAGLAAGKYDAVISSVTINAERKNTMDFTAPYLNAGQILIVRKDTTGKTKLADFAGKTAGAQIGTTGAFEIDKIKAVTKKSYDDIGLGMEDLLNKRIDVIVCDKPTAVSYALKNEKYKAALMIVGEPFTEEFYGIAVKKGNSAVVDKLNAGLKKVVKSGEMKKIEDKWLK